MQNLCKANNFKTNADLEHHEGGSQEKVAAKKERLRFKAEWEWLYQKDMECKNWNYEICSNYLQEGRKKDRKWTLKEQGKLQLKGNIEISEENFRAWNL